MWRDQLTGLEAEHLQALNWFERHAGETVSWKQIKDDYFAKTGSRLVNQAKGIYKPAKSDYALSVRQTLSGPYDDREIQRRADGSWLFPYFQENPNPEQRDREATNRGLMKCMADGVPIGVLIQKKPKPGVAYDVLGLANVLDWRDGYFYLESVASSGALPSRQKRSDAAKQRARIELTSTIEDDFSAATLEDRREKAIAQVVRRKGQPKFRRALLEAYDGRCVVSRCNAQEALEAAHITPYLGEATNHVQNGLLLRSDIHALFDLGLLSIDPNTLQLKLSDVLLRTSYQEFEGVALLAPKRKEAQPSQEALRQHWVWCGFDEST